MTGNGGGPGGFVMHGLVCSAVELSTAAALVQASDASW
jgi:hypothetical protein